MLKFEECFYLMLIILNCFRYISRLIPMYCNIFFSLINDPNFNYKTNQTTFIIPLLYNAFAVLALHHFSRHGPGDSLQSRWGSMQTGH